MIRAQYFLICEFVREGTRNKVDVLGLFDRVFAPRVPAQHTGMVLVALLVGDHDDDLGKKPWRISCSRPSGEMLFEQQGIVDMKPMGGSWLTSSRLLAQLNGLPLPDYGKYMFRIEVNKVEVAAHPLTVAPPPEA